MTEIAENVTKTNDLVAEIAAASNEQAQGIKQVNQGLSQIDQVTQSNTANAEETASSSEEMTSQAANLESLVSRFKLKSQESGINASAPKIQPIVEPSDYLTYDTDINEENEYSA